MLEHLSTGAAIAVFIGAVRHFGMRVRWVPEAVRWWHARLCRALGLHLEARGEPVPGALLVANHVSWLDIPVIGARGKIGFLSKTEVRGWPLIGWMSEIAGTLFIARGANRTEDLVREIEARVGGGECITIFPEGTTTDGTGLQRFHPRLFAAGRQPGMKIQPVAVRYGSNDCPDSVAPFIDDDALVPHIARLIFHPNLEVQVHFLPPFESSGMERRLISERCRTSIANALDIDSTTPPVARAKVRAAQSLPISTSHPPAERRRAAS